MNMNEQAMSQPPQLQNWQMNLEHQIDQFDQTKVGLQSIIRLCEVAIYAMEPAYVYIRDQRSTVQEWLTEYRRLHVIRFRKEAPVLNIDEIQSEQVLDSPRLRKTQVRNMALELGASREEITDELVLDALRARGKRFIAKNPKAVVSTILSGFKLEFEKVEGKRGTFKRRAGQDSSDAS